MISLIDYPSLSLDERIKYARDLMLPSELLILSHDDNVDVVITVLKNPYTSFETLLRCSGSPDSRIRAAVAEGPFPAILRELANDPCYNVCMCVANNKKTPATTLAMLSFDPCWYVRYSVASNENTLNQTLAYLMKDKVFEVRAEAIRSVEKRMHKIN